MIFYQNKFRYQVKHHYHHTKVFLPLCHLNHYKIYNNDLGNKAPVNHNHSGVYQPVGNYVLGTYKNWTTTISFTMTASCAFVMINSHFEVIWFAGDNSISVNYDGKKIYTVEDSIIEIEGTSQTITRSDKKCTITYNGNVSMVAFY